MLLSDCSLRHNKLKLIIDKELPTGGFIRVYSKTSVSSEESSEFTKYPITDSSKEPTVNNWVNSGGNTLQTGVNVHKVYH